MKPYTFVLSGLLSLCAGSTPSAAAAARPNIVLIMSDDIGIGGFSCYGADNYKTPHIDALAKSGARFEYCYSMALCGPSRACLMTGRYAFRTGMVRNVSWKGKVTAGAVHKDLIDFSDFFPTLVDLAGARPPQGVTLDGVTFAPQLLEQRTQTPREWVYGHLQDRRYVRDTRWKLYSDGTLCDMKEAPFGETVIANRTENDSAKEARERLQKVLDQLK
jgi:arylsulfatase A-like enzyme